MFLASNCGRFDGRIPEVILMLNITIVSIAEGHFSPLDNIILTSNGMALSTMRWDPYNLRKLLITVAAVQDVIV